MKRILITGKDSYIGTSFEKWVQQWPELYEVDTIDVKNGNWEQVNFSRYDVILHVAGIVHRKEKIQLKELYYCVNADLPVFIAKKAKDQGVKQFIFLSSMNVYGIEIGVINFDTIPSPNSLYGKSKLKAEQGLEKLRSPEFNIAILRPPMVYGYECKGNYTTFSKIAKKAFLFPRVDNLRSMIYIQHLCEFIRLLINENARGLFFPQNRQYVNSTELAQTIAAVNNHKLTVTKLLNPYVVLMSKIIKSVKKACGSLTYDMEMSNYHNFDYCFMEFVETVRYTEVDSWKTNLPIFK